MKKTAVIFPGIGYHTDKPLLYYSAKLAASKGYDIIRISYPPCEVNLKEADSSQISAFVKECLAAVNAALKDKDLTSNDEILFISKSIGTAIAAAYALSIDHPVRHVFFTPLEETFAYVFKECGIAFNGTDDSWADCATVADLCKGMDIPLTTIEGANHSLETGDVKTDIETISDVMKAVAEILT